ncbi:energy transducer TonB [Rhodanobacter sp. C03]|uniref:energy transducer TonB n=1 Tax=Rhodanobacter sp. C03 TaxID=1945858 RepID=UPI00098652CF|nr:energy transducer TonB [Rhodanobacter sp. C03]OOG60248.1 energy transducer TonB [Rhodanobacter sp. C03]
MKRWLMGLFCVLMACATWAESPAEVRKQAEASMLVTGSIEVMPDGSVQGYTLDHADQLPPIVVQILQQNVPTWKFKFDDQQTVAVKAKMSLRLLAKRVDDTHDAISISAAQFGQDDKVPGESISYKTRLPPRYPGLALHSGVSGTVYLLLRVGRDGRVEDAAAEQVNLTVYASGRDMQLFRDNLARAAITAAREWTFNTPTIGKHVADDYWVAKVPVNFDIRPRGTYKDVPYGRWQSYVPGPRQLVPWVEKKKLLTGAADAVPDGGLYQINQGLQLTTPLSGA